jgi:cyclic pyranopterin phosphate synthase
MSRKGLTHLDSRGEAAMVDVSGKPVSERFARASARLRTTPEVTLAITENRVAKGSVTAAARLAGIMAAKKTADLIPLCHPLSLDVVELDVTAGDGLVSIESRVRCSGRTGAEMEALTAASVAALTVYDMCKALDRTMEIGPVRLEEKSGGKSGHYRRGGQTPQLPVEDV